MVSEIDLEEEVLELDLERSKGWVLILFALLISAHLECNFGRHQIDTVRIAILSGLGMIDGKCRKHIHSHTELNYTKVYAHEILHETFLDDNCGKCRNCIDCIARLCLSDKSFDKGHIHMMIRMEFLRTAGGEGDWQKA